MASFSSLLQAQRSRSKVENVQEDNTLEDNIIRYCKCEGQIMNNTFSMTNQNLRFLRIGVYGPVRERLKTVHHLSGLFDHYYNFSSSLFYRTSLKLNTEHN